MTETRPAPHTELWTGAAVDQLLTGLGVDPRTVRYRVFVTDWRYPSAGLPQRIVCDVADVRRNPLPVVPAEVPQPAPDVVHAYQWFIDPQFDGLTVACQEPITAAGLTATADRDVVTCPACLARIKAGDQ